MKIVFMGSALFSIPSLEGLVNSRHEVLAVVTAHEKKKGRGLVMEKNPVEKLAAREGIHVLTPAKISAPDVVREILSLEPDVIVVVAYGQKIPDELLNTPPFECVNVHPSILPRWRGAAPIQYAILNGDEFTGITTMKMVEKMDAGDILIQEKVFIDPGDTSKTLHDRLAPIGADVLLRTLEKLESRSIIPESQDETGVTLAKKIKKEHGLLDFSHPADKIDRLVRAFSPWPGCFFFYRKKRIKVLETEILEVTTRDTAEPGKVLSRKISEGLIVQTGSCPLRLRRVQPEGKKIMTDRDFLNGMSELIGATLS